MTNNLPKQCPKQVREAHALPTEVPPSLRLSFPSTRVTEAHVVPSEELPSLPLIPQEPPVPGGLSRALARGEVGRESGPCVALNMNHAYSWY